MKYQDTLPKRAREVIFRHQRYRNTDIIKDLRISKASFYNWTNPKHKDYKEEFDLSVRNAKDELIDKLEKAFHELALGYMYEERKEVYDKDGKLKKLIIYKKHKPANVKALIFMLCKLRPEEYCDCGCVRKYFRR
ncbi:MAG: hypothetical protein ACRCV0_04855 [Brevinema sp.]